MDSAFLEVFLCNLGRQTEARPIAGHGAGGRTRYREDITAIEQPREGFIDFLGRKLLVQLPRDFPKTLPAFSYRRRQRTIEFAVKKELSVLGIEAHQIRRLHIDGEIRRELRN